MKQSVCHPIFTMEKVDWRAIFTERKLLRGTSIKEQVDDWPINEDELSKFFTLDNNPVISHGEVTSQIVLVCNGSVYKLKACQYPLRGDERIIIEQQITEGPSVPLEELLDSTKLIVQRFQSIYTFQPGFSCLFLDNFDVKDEHSSYIAVNATFLNSNWLIPLLINSCKNVEVVIAHNEYFRMEKISSQNKIKYLSLFSLDLSSEKAIIEKFPQLILLEYPVRNSITRIRYFGPSPRHRLILFILDQYSRHPDYFISYGNNTHQPDQRANYFLLFSSLMFQDVKKHPEHFCLDTQEMVQDDNRQIMTGPMFRQSLDWKFKQISLFLSSEEAENCFRHLSEEPLTEFISSSWVLRLVIYEKDGPSAPHLVNLNLTKFLINALMIEFQNEQSMDALFVSNLQTLSLNVIPDVVRDIEPISDFVMHFDKVVIRTEGDLLIERIEEMRNLSDLTLIGDKIYFTTQGWKKLWSFLCANITIKKITVNETFRYKDKNSYAKDGSIESKYSHHYVENINTISYLIQIAKDIAIKINRMRTKFMQKLEFIDWNSPVFPMQLKISNGFDLIIIYDGGYIFADPAAIKFITIVHYEKNGVKTSKDSTVKFMVINSFRAYHNMFVKLEILKKIDKITVLTINDTCNLSEDERSKVFKKICSFTKLNTVRGHISQTDLRDLLKTMMKSPLKELNFYISGSPEDVTPDFEQILFRSFKNSQLINSIMTPWRIKSPRCGMVRLTTSSLNEIFNLRENY